MAATLTHFTLDRKDWFSPLWVSITCKVVPEMQCGRCLNSRGICNCSQINLPQSIPILTKCLTESPPILWLLTPRMGKKHYMSIFQTVWVYESVCSEGNCHMVQYEHNPNYLLQGQNCHPSAFRKHLLLSHWHGNWLTALWIIIQKTCGHSAVNVWKQWCRPILRLPSSSTVWVE